MQIFGICFIVYNFYLVNETESRGAPLKLRECAFIKGLAVNADGQLATELFHELAISRLEDLLSGEPNSEGCLEATEFYVSEINSPDRSSLVNQLRKL